MYTESMKKTYIYFPRRTRKFPNECIHQNCSSPQNKMEEENLAHSHITTDPFLFTVLPIHRPLNLPFYKHVKKTLYLSRKNPQIWYSFYICVNPCRANMQTIFYFSGVLGKILVMPFLIWPKAEEAKWFL